MSWYTFIPQLFNMSLTAGIAICLVLFLRLLLKMAPKVISYALWGVVLFRLLCPVSIESGFSLYTFFDVPTENSGTMTSVIQYVPENIVHMENPSVTLPVPGAGNVINNALPQGREQLVADPLEAPMSFTTYIWMIGVLVMMICSFVSYIRLRRTLLVSVKLRDNIYLADDIASPFVMGLTRPEIYLPSSLSEKERDYIILHEQHHIRRGDHIVKLLSFAALCLHWFNPLVWAAFIYSGRDMEMSCDEAVLQKLGEEIRVDYTTSLIRLATGRRMIAGTPLAFGEGDTMGRVKNIARWKKPAVWVVGTAVIVCSAAVVCLITNPMSTDNRLWDGQLPNGVYTGTALIAQHGGLSYLPQDGTYYARIHLNRGRMTLTADDQNLLYDSDAYDTESFTRSEFVDYLSELYLFDYVNGVMKNAELWNYTLPDMKSVLALRYYTDDTRTEVAYSVYCFDGIPTWFAQKNSLRIYEIDPIPGETEHISMTPTTANVSGAFDSYLYVPIDGANYRYERIADDPASVTKGKRIHTFTEEADPQDVEWHVYAVGEYPNHSMVLAEAGDDYVQLYRYSPPKAVDPTLLEQAKADGKIVLEEGYAASGQAVWNTFYKMSSEGKHVSAEIVHYYTLENGNYDETYYEVYKEDYPSMYTFGLTYDGDTYTLTWNEYGTEHVRKYKYLRKFEETLMTQYSSVSPQKISRYVLTDNNTATWDDLIRGSYSSQLGDYIDYYTIYSLS